MEAITELRKHVQGGKLVIGTAEVMKMLKQNKLAKVFVASNSLPSVKDSLGQYGPDAGCEVVQLEIPNDELGVMCKKPFSISVVGVLR
ncbi:ribosomal L7Ae/L30e/S12e/Gadd45 family protein [Candidatus Woesearchaeota archaeon]|nr:ribosomal L7Ae/L30e/S12e/Gadd45 family protein [Candidatus Woesearchaeota archaeon]